jgi:hypothetical protein
MIQRRGTAGPGCFQARGLTNNRARPKNLDSEDDWRSKIKKYIIN